MFFKIKRKLKTFFKNWKADVCFSRKLARYRLLDNLFSCLRLKRISDKYFEKETQFIIDYLKKDTEDIIEKYKDADYEGVFTANAPIWVCWWTGIDSAPQLVQQCVKSIKKNSGSHTVNFIDKDNYMNYIDIPDFIMRKQKEGKMGLAHFADYLRVSLLEKYGGLWLDATIFCSEIIPEEYFLNPFFTLKSPYRESRYVSHFQWVTFCLGGWKGNVFYSFMKEVFEQYWEKENLAIDYLFFDHLIYIARESIPSIKKHMDAVPENTPHRDDLQAAMNACLPAEGFEKIIKDDTTLYKLSWREKYSECTPAGKESVYGYFINTMNGG